MCVQDAASTERRHPDMFDNHPLLQPRMRSVLLDWLIEVCEVYRLHRETYYLAMDFLDRYLALTKNLPKTQLQLIGKPSLASLNLLFLRFYSMSIILFFLLQF